MPYFPEKETSELTIDDLNLITPNDINKFVTWMKDKQELSDRTCARRFSDEAKEYIQDYLRSREIHGEKLAQ